MTIELHKAAEIAATRKFCRFIFIPETEISWLFNAAASGTALADCIAGRTRDAPGEGPMLLGMTAASSAIDLIKTLTQGSSSSSSSKSASSTTFSADSGATFTAATSSASSGGQTSLISPDTMNALLAAQSQSGGSSSATSPSDALKDLFAKIDSDGDGKITKSEFENALGAGGTNTANADSVFAKLDKDGDGSVSLGELSSALKGGHHAHRSKSGGGGGGGGGGADALLQAVDGATSTSTTNSDGSVTTSLTYADGSKVTMTQPAAASQSSSATRSYNALEQMIQQQANRFAQTTSSSLSVSV